MSKQAVVRLAQVIVQLANQPMYVQLVRVIIISTPQQVPQQLHVSQLALQELSPTPKTTNVMLVKVHVTIALQRLYV